MRWIAIYLRWTGHTKSNEKQNRLRESQSQLSDLLSRFSPTLVKHQETNHSETLGVLVEISTCFRLFGGSEALLKQLLLTVQKWEANQPDVHVQVASWNTAQGAWWLAKQQPATSLEQLQTMHQSSNATLNVLHTSCLDLTTAQRRLLEQCGLWNLQQINALPRDSIQRRFGAELLSELDKGYGQQLDLRNTYSPLLVFAADQEMPFHATTLSLILQTVTNLLAKLERWLKERQLATNHLMWVFRQPHSKFHLQTRSSRLLQTQHEWRVLIENQLNQQHFDDDVQHIELTCNQLAAFTPRNHSLLFEDFSEQSNQWQATCDKLRARLGTQSILFPSLESDPRPECSFSFKPELARKVKTKSTEHDLSSWHVRPVWLLEQPIALTPRKQWNILSGPERVEFGWWDSRPCKRDYYRAINANQQQAWIFQDLEAEASKDSWYLHGYFS